MKKVFLSLSFILSLILSLQGIGFVYAKTISLDPARVRLSVAPGDVKSGVIKIDNPSEQEIKVKAYLEDWRYRSYAEGTKEFFSAGTTPLSCASWINFSPAEFTIPSFGRQVVNYTVRLPQEAKGAYFSVMFFETELVGEKDNPESTVKLKARLGTLFSIETQGELICEAGLKDIKVNREEGLIKIYANFKNSGNTDIAPKVMFHIIDAQGKVFSRGKFSDIFTLPKDAGEIYAKSKEDLAAGDYILVITMNLGRGLPQVLEVPIKVDESKISLASNS